MINQRAIQATCIFCINYCSVKYKFAREFRVQLPLVYFYRSSLLKSNTYTRSSIRRNQAGKVPRKIPFDRQKSTANNDYPFQSPLGIFEIKTTSRKMRRNSIGPRVYFVKSKRDHWVHPHERKRRDVHTTRPCACGKRTWQSCAHCVFMYVRVDVHKTKRYKLVTHACTFVWPTGATVPVLCSSVCRRAHVTPAATRPSVNT